MVTDGVHCIEVACLNLTLQWQIGFRSSLLPLLFASLTLGNLSQYDMGLGIIVHRTGILFLVQNAYSRITDAVNLLEIARVDRVKYKLANIKIRLSLGH